MVFIIALFSRESGKVNRKFNTKIWFKRKSGTLENIKKIFSNKKIGKEILTLGDIQIEKNNFYRYKGSIFRGTDVDINNILVSKKISFGEKNHKYFIGYLHDN